MTMPDFFLYLLWLEILCVFGFIGVAWWYIRDLGKEDEDDDI